MAQFLLGIVETKRSERCMANGRSPSRSGEERECNLLLKYPETERWGYECLKRKWQHIKDEKAIRKILPTMPLN
jgi:hypothetical protein